MSLLKPGLGDMLDRASILARKVVEGREDLRAELEALGGDSTSIVMLAALNAAIWQREDRLRELRVQRGDDAEVARTAFAIQGLNDQRATLIAELNGTKSEKVYR